MRESEKQDLNIQGENTSESVILASQVRQELFSIIDRSNEIASEPKKISLIQQMLDLMIDVTLAESANYFQLDHATDELIVVCVRGDNENQNIVGLRLNRQHVLPGIPKHSKQPVVIGDLPSVPYWLRTVDPENATSKLNVINLPIVFKENILGVVQLFNFKQANLDLLSVLSNRLAVEINHRTEVDNSQQLNLRLWTLIDVLGEVAGTLDRNRLLHMVTENASRLVNAERSSIFLVDPETKEMSFQVAFRSPEQENLQTSESNLIEKHYSQNKPPIINNKRSDEFGYFNRSAITVPLRSETLPTGHAEGQEHVLGGLMVHNKHNESFLEVDAQLMQILANQASTFLQVADMYESAGELFLGIIKALAAAIDAKDPYTQGHSQRVSDYSVLISQELGLDESLVDDIRIGSLLHDIGKIGIPDSILSKEGSLTGEEYAIIQGHPNTGVNILSQVQLFVPMLPAIAEHHERLDGSGYPHRKSGKQISLVGRIVAVADVFDAMTSHRPYRPALSVPEVLSYLRKFSDTLFDSACVDALVTILAKSNQTEER